MCVGPDSVGWRQSGGCVTGYSYIRGLHIFFWTGAQLGLIVLVCVGRWRSCDVEQNHISSVLSARLVVQVMICDDFCVTAVSPVPSVLRRCWLGGRKGIRPVKNWVVGCWRGYLSGVRCRLAYGPADATATHVSRSSKIQIGCTFLVPAHLGSPGKRAVKWVSVCAVSPILSKNFKYCERCCLNPLPIKNKCSSAALDLMSKSTTLVCPKSRIC